MISVNALVQVVGIASVMPFLALIANPNAIEEQAFLRFAYEAFSFSSTSSFLVFVGLMVLAALLLSNAFAAATEYMMLRFSWDMNHSLSVRMLRTYLYKPYAYFLDQNTAGLSKNLLGEVKQAVSGFLVAGMNLIARSIVAVFVLALLIAVEPLLALATMLFLGIAYGAVFLVVQRSMAEAGRLRSTADRERFKAAAEALAGIKEIKLLGLEEPFLKRYQRPSRRYSRHMARQQVISLLPRYAFETIAFGGMLIIVLYMMVRGDGLLALLPTLGVYAFASYRLLPALQGIFSSLANLRFSVASVDLLYEDLDQVPPAERAPRHGIEPLPARKHLALRGVSFAYSSGRHPVLSHLDLDIAANTTVALVGATGSGKTTIVDLLLGLLRPESGTLSVDGVPVTAGNLANWQKNLGYVPQDIYLADDTVAGNIAFGVRPERIDLAAVEVAARRANIHDFIVDELPEGYATSVGERGVRLSGGQRQRLGIARALFNDPDVLILDEATSALDTVTEEGIFASVREIGRTKTVIMIAHRISTVQHCDVIFVLDHGRVVSRGTYAELIEGSPEFRALAQVPEPEELEAAR